MKCILFVLILLLVLAFTVSAQGFTDYGVKAGLNFANIGGDNASSLKSINQFAVGGFVTYNVIDQFDLQGELLYDVKGCKDSLNTTKLSYLDINILAKYQIPVLVTFKPSVYVGPSLGLELSATGAPDISNSISKTDFSVIFGIGVAHKVGNGSVTLDVRYDLGLANINKSGNPANTNQVLAILVGYSFM